MTRTHTTQTAGEAGLIELDIDFPDVCTQGIAFLAHPITTQGGSKDHKVITTMAKALVSGGWLVVRPNCRGAGRNGRDDGGRERPCLPGGDANAGQQPGHLSPDACHWKVNQKNETGLLESGPSLLL